jgi:hypothetical protein
MDEDLLHKLFPRDEHLKAMQDAMRRGHGFMLNGKHVPFKDVMKETPDAD